METKKYLVISNAEEMDINALKLMGACTKRGDDEKIGYYGTGLKYGIAVLLRNGISVRCFSGTREIVLGVQDVDFRGVTFGVLTVNGEKTGITTEMGVDWEIWHAVREIYCNALDENDSRISIGVVDIRGEEGRTTFFIDGQPLAPVIDHWDEYFAFRRDAIVESKDCLYRVYTALGDRVSVFRRGIRCFNEDYKGLYDYDFYDMEISEVRMVKYLSHLGSRLGCLWFEHATPEMVMKYVNLYKMLRCENEIDAYIEHYIDWSYIGSHASQAWHDVLIGKVLVPFEYEGQYDGHVSDDVKVVLPADLIRALVSVYDDLTSIVDINDWFVTIPITDRHKQMINRAMSFLRGMCRYQIRPVHYRHGYNIDLSISNGAEPDDLILNIGDTVFDSGIRELVAKILVGVFALEGDVHLHNLNRTGDRLARVICGKMIDMIGDMKGEYL